MKRQDLSNKRFGRLLVMSFTGLVHIGNKNRAMWLCKCDCGNEKEILGQSLNSGSVNSCGCLHKENAQKQGYKNRKSFGESSLNSLYGKYKYQASRRNKTFDLSLDEFKELSTKNCFYCGSEPMSKSVAARRCYGNYIYNGIDRVDNSKGYTIDNCVPCCETCNKAKLQMSMNEFKEWVGKVYERFYTP